MGEMGAKHLLVLLLPCPERRSRLFEGRCEKESGHPPSRTQDPGALGRPVRPALRWQGADEGLLEDQVEGPLQFEKIPAKRLIGWKAGATGQESRDRGFRPIADPYIREAVFPQPGRLMGLTRAGDEDAPGTGRQGLQEVQYGRADAPDIPGRIALQIAVLPVSCVQIIHFARCCRKGMRNPLWAPDHALNLKGHLLTLDRPRIMGILNVTPDSFHADSRVPSLQSAVDRAGSMAEQGAHILDVGGYSSRPGAADVPLQEEIDRVVPVVEALQKALPAMPLAVDTFRSAVAREALDAGAAMVNDISGGDLDPDMWDLVVQRQVPYVMMHMQGTPATMQDQPTYREVVTDLLDHFIARIGRLRELGLHDLILDPGFGFGKTRAQNYALLQGLHQFRILGCPILAGLSRKSMIWKPLGISPADALNGTTALHMVALQQGVHMLRVHDPGPAREVIALWQELRQAAEDRPEDSPVTASDHHG